MANEEVPEDWRRFRDEINVLRNEAWESVKRRLHPRQGGAVAFYDMCMDFLNRIHEGLGRETALRYVGYHSLIGSTVEYKKSPEHDLPHPHSAKAFYERIIDGNIDWTPAIARHAKPDNPAP